MGRRSLSAAFAEVVREQRAKRGVSQEDLAHDAGLHRTYVGLIERGLRNPTVEVAHALALALGTTLSDLIRARRVGSDGLSA